MMHINAENSTQEKTREGVKNQKQTSHFINRPPLPLRKSMLWWTWPGASMCSDSSDNTVRLDSSCSGLEAWTFI